MADKYETYKSSLQKGLVEMSMYKDCWVFTDNIQEGRLDWIENLDVRDDDVFVTGFPKSGVTWLIESVYLAAHGADTVQATSSLQADRVPFLENPRNTLESVTNLPSQRMLKTHLPYHLLPRQLQQGKGKVVYIFRNGKDVSVSLYHFVKFIILFDYQGSFGDFFKDFEAGKVMYGPWWSHVASFWEHRQQTNLLMVSYEDLKHNYTCVLQRISKFLNKELTDEQVSKIGDFCSFEKMRTNDMANFSHLIKEKQMKEDRGSIGLMRRGVIGDWENYYTKEQVERMDELVKDKLALLGLSYSDTEQKWKYDS